MRGQKYGLLYAIERVGIDAHHFEHLIFRCDCGNAVVLRGSHVHAGLIKSCGCIRNTFTTPDIRTGVVFPDGEIYHVWRDMIKRGYSNAVAGRGKLPPPLWRRFKYFEAWALSHGYVRGAQLMFKDENGNFDGANCYFAAS